MSEANTVTNGHHRRPVRIANCSGAASDPGFQRYRQATAGPIDAITGRQPLGRMRCCADSFKVTTWQR